jgi:hypothetical protein
MPIRNNRANARYCDRDDLDSALTQGGLALDVLSNAATPLNVEIGFRHTPSARVLRELLADHDRYPATMADFSAFSSSDWVTQSAVNEASNK